jgi:hypothetical protein
MKSIAVLALTLVMSQANALAVSVGSLTALDQVLDLGKDCKGSARLIRSGSGVALDIQSQCSNVFFTNLLGFRTDQKLAGSDQNNYGIVPIVGNPGDSLTITIAGNPYINSGGAKGTAVVVIVVIPQTSSLASSQIPNNWDYGWSTSDRCYLYDSANKGVQLMSDDVCYSGTRNLPVDYFYSYDLDHTGCYLWVDRYTQVSSQQVKKDLCN